MHDIKNGADPVERDRDGEGLHYVPCDRVAQPAQERDPDDSPDRRLHDAPPESMVLRGFHDAPSVLAVLGRGSSLRGEILEEIGSGFHSERLEDLHGLCLAVRVWMGPVLLRGFE